MQKKNQRKEEKPGLLLPAGGGSIGQLLISVTKYLRQANFLFVCFKKGDLVDL